MDEFWGLLAVLIPLIIMLFEKKKEKTKVKKVGKARKGESAAAARPDASAARPDASAARPDASAARPDASFGKEYPSMEGEWTWGDVEVELPDSFDVFPGKTVPSGIDTSTATVELVSLEEYLPEQEPVGIGNNTREVVVGETLTTDQRSEDMFLGEEGKAEGLQDGISLRDAIVHQAILERKYL